MSLTEREAPDRSTASGEHADDIYKPKTTLAPRELGRFHSVDEVARVYGWPAVQPLLDAALTADDLGLAVAQDIADMRGRKGRKLYEKALEEGIDAVPEAPESMKRLFAAVDTVPDWVDWDQLRRGSIAYFRAGPLVSFALTCSVIAGSERAYGITRPIVFTGRFEALAAIRARETTRWLVAAVRPDGLRRDAEGFKLTLQVRLLHAMTRRGLSKSPNWDWDDWGMPLSDADGLYAISYDFTEAMVAPLQKIGYRFSQQELDDIYALWRYIGFLMGVPEHLLHRGPAQGKQFADMYLSMDPGADDECRSLLRCLIDTATPEEESGLDVFPAIVTKLFPPLRLRKLLYGFTRYWAGEEVADELGVPNTPFKHVPKAVKPFVKVQEAVRRAGLIDDEKMCWSTLALLEKAAAPQEEDEQTIAPTETVESAIEQRTPRWEGKRGRSHGTVAHAPLGRPATPKAKPGKRA